ncbi:MAG: hypothetical protein WCF04_08045 [Candidatus Nanopelagicales bacterium]
MAERGDDFDLRWAEIVADLTTGPDALDDSVADGESRPSRPQDPTRAESEAGTAGDEHLADGPRRPAADEGRSTVEDGLAALFEPLRRAQSDPEAPSGAGADHQGSQKGTADPGGQPPDAFVDNWADEGHFAPPPPPELPAGTPLKRLAWVGTLGGPATLAFIAFTGWDAPRAVGIAAGLAFLGGFVTLVWQLPESRDDGWDDGARL